MLATGQLGAEGKGYGTITGQGNGQGGREHGQKADQLPGARDIEDPEHRAFIAEYWGIPEADLPHAGISAVELVHAFREGNVKGLLGLCNNPLVSMPNVDRIAADYDALEFHVQLDFFLSRPPSARTSSCRRWSGRRTPVSPPTPREDRPAPPGRGPAGRGKAGLVDPVRDRRPARTRRAVRLRLGRGRLRGASRSERRWHRRLLGGDVRAAGGDRRPVLAGPLRGSPRHPRLFEDGRFFFPDGRARFSPVEWGAPTESDDDEYPMLLTTGRTVAHFLSGNQTRRIGTLVEQTPRPWVEVHPSLGFVTGDPVRVVTRRGTSRSPLVTDTIRPDTAFVPYHWAKRVAANLLTIDALHPISKIPEYKVCACRIERGDVVDATPPPPQAPGSTTPGV